MKMLAADGEIIVLGYDHHEPECCRCQEQKCPEAHEFGCHYVQKMNTRYLIFQVVTDNGGWHLQTQHGV
jgi:hypothetical protein